MSETDLVKRQNFKRNLKSAWQQKISRKMIKIECGFPRLFCNGCFVCGGRGYILVDDAVDIKIGDMTKCGNNPAWLHYIPNSLVNYATPTIYLFIPSSHFINDKVRIRFNNGVEQLSDLDDILYDSLEHETIHYLLAKMFNMYLSKKLDNIHRAMFE